MQPQSDVRGWRYLFTRRAAPLHPSPLFEKPPCPVPGWISSHVACPSILRGFMIPPCPFTCLLTCRSTYLSAFEPCRSYEQAERGLETSFLPEARQPCMYACMLARSGIWTCRCRLPSIVYRLCIRGAAAGSREGWMTGGRELWRWTLLFLFEIFTIDRPRISQSLDTSS